MVRELKPDEWPFATDKERAAGWHEARFDRRRRRRSGRAEDGQALDVERLARATPEEAARRSVMQWLGQWGIHNDAEIHGLLDGYADAVREAALGDRAAEEGPPLDFGSQVAHSGGLPKDLKARIDAIEGRR